MVNKIMSLCIFALLLFSVTVAVHAFELTNPSTMGSSTETVTKVSKDDAIKLGTKCLNEYFDCDIAKNYYEPNIKLNTVETLNNEAEWDINWYPNDNRSDIISVIIGADDGKLLSYYRSRYSEDIKSKQNKIIGEEQAKKSVENVINKITPGILNKIRFMISPNSNRDIKANQYEFNYVRIVNGVEYINNFINVVYDYLEGKIISYNITWEDQLKFPDKSGIIDENKATRILYNQLKMKLTYIQVRNTKANNTTNIRLLYIPDFSKGDMVDAKSGNLSYSEALKGDDKLDLSEKEKVEIAKAYKAQDNNQKELDKVSAEKIIQNMINTII